MSVEILCRKCENIAYKPLDPEEWYRIAAPWYLTRGGSGFYMFKNNRNHQTGDKIDVDVIGQYLTKKSPLLVETDGRTKFVQ